MNTFAKIPMIITDEPMTEQEIQAEWLNRRETRLGMLCGSGDPTMAQLEIAAKEADEWRKGWEDAQGEVMWI